MKKIIVAYFSASGVTKKVAENMANAVKADLFEIKPEQPYTHADLNWMNKQSRSTFEMKDRNCRPVMTAKPDVSGYDVILIGFPIWWYREPSIIDTFVESNAEALGGKTIVPFAASGGSGMGDSSANLQALASKAKVVEGRRFSVNVDSDTLKKWAAEFTK